VYPQTAQELLENTYVDGIQFGSDDKQDLYKFKHESSELLGTAGFALHKWHSNVVELEDTERVHTECADDMDTTFAKHSVGARNSETKILGVPWNKERDELSVDFTKCIDRAENQKVTKRTIISTINYVFDVLGLVSPVLIIAKLLFSQACLLKLSWDEEVPSELLNQWTKWIRELKKHMCLSVPRCCIFQSKDRRCTYIHGFSDASKQAVSAVVYVVVKASDGSSSQNLLVSKSRVAPKGLTIPRLELVGAHLLANLISHVTQALRNYEFERIYGWTDSTTVLYWLRNKGTWSRYVRNRVQKVREVDFINWGYVPSEENPIDQGTRGVYPAHLTSFWFHGPSWLPNRQRVAKAA